MRLMRATMTIMLIRRSAGRAEPRRTSGVQFELVSAPQTSVMPFLKVNTRIWIGDDANFHPNHTF